mmetsp:Transcript_36832/g.92339  ORF Transcript_36832/g.92339 Transcript_36832/m.92339 type:complete len:229 (+) Transcript_36832:918-1604(+)
MAAQCGEYVSASLCHVLLLASGIEVGERLDHAARVKVRPFGDEELCDEHLDCVEHLGVELLVALLPHLLELEVEDVAAEEVRQMQTLQVAVQVTRVAHVLQPASWLGEFDLHTAARAARQLPHGHDLLGGGRGRGGLGQIATATTRAAEAVIGRAKLLSMEIRWWWQVYRRLVERPKGCIRRRGRRYPTVVFQTRRRQEVVRLVQNPTTTNQRRVLHGRHVAHGRGAS